MNATASRDASAKVSIMAPMASKIAEDLILPMMQYVGIKEIELNKIESANYTKIVPDIKCFDKTPENMVSYAMIVKEAIAILLASLGMPKLKINADPGEEKVLVDGYEQLDAIYKSAKVSEDDAAEEKKEGSVKEDDHKCEAGKCKCHKA